MKLVTFGCSLTYGTGLSDCWDGSMSGKHPSKLAWPNRLQNLMNIKMIKNFSGGGQSNKEIAYTIQKELSKGTIKQDDVVIVQWTYPDRHCIIAKDRVIRLYPYQVERRHKEADVDKRMSKVHYRHLHDNYDMLYQTATHQDYIYHKLKQLNIKQFHMFIDPTDNYFEWSDVPFLKTSISRIRALHPKALDNQHPGEQAHIEVAKSIYKEIEMSINV